MTTGWDMVPETAKALSAPATKLIEVIAAGCGRAYGPTDIRRTAKAQADAQIILAEAEARQSEIALRAAHRLFQVEENRQRNIDSIVSIAAKQLPEEVSEVPVDQDWAARFFREAQDISNEQMQQLWGKLLAGEVARPASFSPRTLAIVANLTPDEAAKFGAVCSLISKLPEGELATFLKDANSPHAKSRGLSYREFQGLQAAGLVSNSELGRSLLLDQAECQYPIERPGGLLLLATGTMANINAGALELGVISLTPAGAELFSIADWPPSPEYDEEVVKTIRACQGWTVEKRLIVGRTEQGIRHVPLPT
jgi:uncharacterized repeat protein (TIGR03899 family)